MKELVEKYDELFGENHHKICVGKNCQCHIEVKKFISKALDQVRLETIREVVEMLDKGVNVKVLTGEYDEKIVSFVKEISNQTLLKLKFLLNKLK